MFVCNEAPIVLRVRGRAGPRRVLSTGVVDSLSSLSPPPCIRSSIEDSPSLDVTASSALNCASLGVLSMGVLLRVDAGVL